MARVLWLFLLGCAARPAPQTPEVPPLDDIEIRIIHANIGCIPAVTDCAPPSVQLMLRNGTQPAKVRVLRVAIGDWQGRSLNLPAHTPTVWGADGYEPWNERIDGGDVMPIQYGLARVDWDHFEDRSQVHATFVIVEVDGRERTYAVPSIELESIDEISAR